MFDQMNNGKCARTNNEPNNEKNELETKEWYKRKKVSDGESVMNDANEELDADESLESRKSRVDSM